MSLHWLHATAPSTSNSGVSLFSTYGFVSKALAQVVEAAFYSGCENYPKFPNSLEVTPSVIEPDVRDENRAYQCGEYPIGDVQVPLDWKPLDVVEFETPEYSHNGVLFDIDIQPITMNVPIALYRLPWQSRRESYSIADQSNFANAESSHIVGKVLSSGAERADPDPFVRIHDTDFWFNVSFDKPANVSADADAYFTLCAQLPGGRVRAEMFETDIVLTTESVTERTSRIDWIDLGELTFSDYRMCATAALTEPQGDLNAFLPPEGIPPVGVRFVDARIEGIELDYHQGIKLYGDFDPLHDAVIGTLLEGLNTILVDGISISIGGNEVINFDGPGPLLWNGLLKSELEAELLTQLAAVAAELTNLVSNPPGRVPG
ncbi:MAG: hypothetical protein AAFY60_19010, partial [Myxococcota bacterium]